MTAVDGVKFGISYSGLTEWNGGVSHISVINIQLEDADKEVFARLARTIQEATQYPQFQMGNALLNTSYEAPSDVITLPVSVAKTIKLSARIFLDSGRVAPGGNLPVFLESAPTFVDGRCYNIHVIRGADGVLQGKVVEVSERELHRQIRLARFYPRSVIYTAQKTIQLNREQEELYSDVESIVYVMDGWVARFATEVNLPPSTNPSIHENIARDAIKERIQQIDPSVIKSFLKVKKGAEEECKDPARLSANIQACLNAQQDTMGHEGYAFVMRKVLEAFSGVKAPLHKKKIEEFAIQFADRYKKK